MTTEFLRKLPAVAVLASTLVFSSAASAATIYDNSVNDLTNRYSPGLLEVGDEIFLGGSERYLTGFSFEYYALVGGVGSGIFSGAPKVQITFYLNNGPLSSGYPSPGTSFYTSGWITIPNPTERATMVLDQFADFGGGFYIPFGAPGISNITWSVQFKDMGGSDELGVDLYSLPVIGSQVGSGDYWEFTGPGWTLKTNISGAPMNFAAKFDAVVPEPSSAALAVLGGVGLIVLRWRMRK